MLEIPPSLRVALQVVKAHFWLCMVQSLALAQILEEAFEFRNVWQVCMV